MATYKDLGNPLFVTVSKDTSGKDKIGSVYFEHGRIRLVHSHGPCIELHKDIYERISENLDLTEGHLECKRYKDVANDNRLVEHYLYIFNDSKKKPVLCRTHRSRGNCLDINDKECKTLKSRLEDIFKILNNQEYILCQEIFKNYVRKKNDISLIKESYIYKTISKISYEIYNLDKEHIFKPTEYKFDKIK